MTPSVATPPLRSLTWLRAALAIALLAVCVVGLARPAAAAPNSITQPDVGGQYSSLELDASGNPVVSHFDPATQKLKVVYCGNADCSGGNTLAAPDDMAVLVAGIGHTSLALAGSVPVITHYDSGPKDLRFVHCGNPSCGAATLRSLDSGPIDNVGIYASIAIDGGGNPVVAYYYEPFDILRLLACDDPTCSSYSEQDVDTAPITGLYPSLQLDASGFPVISYYAQTSGDLMLARCSDASCTSRIVTTVDGASPSVQVGKYTSLALDASGFPVISYYDETNGDLKIAHCGDATCSGGNSITAADINGNVGQYTSLALDANGHPVVSYYSVSSSALKVLYCGNTTCTAGPTIVTPDSAGVVGQYTSLELSAVGYPVVSYYDETDARLNILACGDALCVGTPSGVGGLTELPDVRMPGARDGSSLHWTMLAVGTMAIVLALTATRRKYSG